MLQQADEHQQEEVSEEHGLYGTEPKAVNRQGQNTVHNLLRTLKGVGHQMCKPARNGLTG